MRLAQYAEKTPGFESPELLALSGVGTVLVGSFGSVSVVVDGRS
jgi:hypothetical protein